MRRFFPPLAAILFAALVSPLALRAAPCLPATIPDDAYIGILDGNDGTGPDAGMVCCSVAVAAAIPGVISDVAVDLWITHTWIGDLVVKLKSPSGTVSTVLSRPGFAESADNGGGCCGSATNWDGTLIDFASQSGRPSAEQMGAGLATSEAVCLDDGICAYKPAPDSAAGVGLGKDFDGEDYVGVWQICVGDAASIAIGTWNGENFKIQLDRKIPCVCGGKFRGGDRVKYVVPPVAPELDSAGQGRPGPVTGAPPPLGTEGDVMCGYQYAAFDEILVSWAGYSGGHDGNNACDCPTGNLGGGLATSGWFVACNAAQLVMPFLDDFETGNTIRWAKVVN